MAGDGTVPVLIVERVGPTLDGSEVLVFCGVYLDGEVWISWQMSFRQLSVV